jgi:hypothetical protein
MSTLVFTPIDDAVADKFGNLVSVETFEGLANNLNYLIDSMPIGSKVPILVGLPGVPAPDPTIWRLCEGGKVTDQNSKLHDQTLPDDRGRYPKGASTIGQSGLLGGTNFKSFAHSHGGQTLANDNGDDNSDTDDDYITIYQHTHPIPTDLATPVNLEPVHIRVSFYIKIR